MPSAWECLYTTVLVMGSAIVAAKLRHGAPDLVIRPNVGLFRTLDFFQASAILRVAEPVKAEVKEKLGACSKARRPLPPLAEKIREQRGRFVLADAAHTPRAGGGKSATRKTARRSPPRPPFGSAAP